MRIRREAGRVAEFVPEIFQMLFGEAAFEESPGIESGRGVPLQVEKIAGLIADAAPKEVVEAHLRQSGKRGKCRDVAADVGVVLVGPNDHRRRIPADEALDPPFQRTVAGVRHLFLDRNRVHIGSCHVRGGFDAQASRAIRELVKQIGSPVRPPVLDYLLECFQPFRRFLWVQVRQPFFFWFQHEMYKRC